MSERDVIAGRYRPLRPIGSGGMGVVWLAHDERLGRDVAVKRLHPRWVAGDEDAGVASQRAMREARITARLHHPHAVGVFDVVQHEGQPCLVMEYFPSTSLAEHAAGTPGPTVVEVARIGGQVASALAAAHDLGIVHRDVKPANVLIAPDGTAKISDFGIAHALGDDSLTSTGLVTGTPAYLAPEVARGEPSSSASDVFSLASTLYTVLEGEPPFGRHENAMAVLHRVASGDIRTPRASGPLTPLLTDMLAPAPAARPTMAEAAATLAEIAEAGTAVGEAADPGSGDRAPDVVPLPPASTAPVEEGADDDLLRVFREGDGTSRAPAAPAPRRRRGRAVPVLVALLVAAALVALVVQRPDTPSASDPTGSATPATTSPEPTPTPTRDTPTSTPTASATPRPSPRPSAPPASPATSAPTAAQLRDALVDYYALLPGDLDAGWARLTDRYRRTTARSREYYADFWGGMDRVRVSEVTASPPDAVTARLTYTTDDGRVVVERTANRLVRDGGVLKIDRSTVLSSTGG